jgi:hypothetical protein
MKNEFYVQMKECFIKHSDLKDDYPELYETIELIIKAIDLQEQSNEVNKKLNELNSEKKEK